jgi:hypothetical protein
MGGERMKHTKGPWKAEQFDAESWKIYGDGIVVSGGVREADARLIAAAPELLEALRNMVNMARNGRLTNEDIRQAHEAIAKA